METYTAQVDVVRETTDSIIVRPKPYEGHEHFVFDKKSEKSHAVMTPVKIARKHLYICSDCLGIPNAKDPSDPRVSSGTLVIPAWRAKQLCMWKRAD